MVNTFGWKLADTHLRKKLHLRETSHFDVLLNELIRNMSHLLLPIAIFVKKITMFDPSKRYSVTLIKFICYQLIALDMLGSI